MNISKFTLAQLFPTLNLFGEGTLTLTANNGEMQYVWSGPSESNGALTFVEVPSSIAVAMRANQTVKFTQGPAKQLTVTGLTAGQLMLLAPRFSNTEPTSKPKRPSYSPRQESDASDLTYSLKA